jgi:hypothetical protein
VVTVQANPLTLKGAHQRLGYQRHYADRLDELLMLTDLTPTETAELINIRSKFDRYLVEGAVLEGQVRILSVNPLLRLSGFNRSPITIQVEISNSKFKNAIELCRQYPPYKLFDFLENISFLKCVRI